MHPPIQTQDNFLVMRELDPEQFAPGIACTLEEDTARQEFKQEADVNFLIKKYGQPVPAAYPTGDTDFDVDLMTAYQAVENARQGYQNLAPHLRRSVTFDGFLQALATGLPLPTAPAPEVSSGGGVVAATEGRQ